MAQNTITLATAQEWAGNWRKDQPDTVKAFLIPGSDISDLYNDILTKGGQDVRGYLGIDDKGEYKMFLVAVDSNGNDLVNLGIYDMTTPCPPMCDVNSPLYTLK